MAIWLGEAGGIRIGRPSSERFYAHIEPSDVDISANRFGFDRAVDFLVTGDRVWLRRVDDEGNPSTSTLDFIDPSGWLDGAAHSDGEWFVNTDAVGGVRLFKTWDAALANKTSDAVRIAVPSGTYRVSIELVGGDDSCLAQTISWVLNTDREVADISSLGDGFRQQQATMVSGSGELDCFFDSQARQCDAVYADDGIEASLYLHRLVLRQEIGARFRGVFLLKQSNAVPLDVMLNLEERRRELFYLCDCVVTGVATELSAEDAIHSKITFVTTGPIQLLYDFPHGYLLLEQGVSDKVLQETGFGILLEVPS